MNEGTAQGQRYLPAPPMRAARQFGVDELPLHQLAAMAAGLAARLRFVDLGNHETGTWSPLFQGDESLLLAVIAGFDRHGAQVAFGRSEGAAGVEPLADGVAGLVAQLDGWFRLLPSTDDQGPMALAAALRQRIGQHASPELKLQVARVWPLLAGRCGLDNAMQPIDPASLWWMPGPDRSESVQDPRAALRRLFHSLLSVVARVQGSALELLPASLQTQQHEPAAGLLLAFLQLYATVQGRMNTFTDRHIDFYYRRCLGLAPRAAQADRIHVVCTAAARAPLPLVVPAGTAFAAGKDSAGRLIEFKSEDELLLGDARVAAVCTLRLERDELIAPEGELGYVTRAKATRLTMPAPAGWHWPLFGGSAPPESGCEDARLGLALATPLLQLEEGQRLVLATLQLRWPGGGWPVLLDKALKASSPEAFRRAFGRLFSCWLLSTRDPLMPTPAQPIHPDLLRLRDRALALALPGPQSAQDAACWDAGEPLYLLWGQGRDHRGAAEPPQRDLIFDRLLRHAFDVDFTGAEGWLCASHVQIRRAAATAADGGGLQVMVHLHQADPAVVGCDRTVHGAIWPTRLPVMRVQTTTRARMFPYSLFVGAALDEARLEVTVKGVRNLVLHNNLGRLDPSKAFTPFGPLPTQSSYLVLGAPEAGRKNLDELVLNLRWGGLPRDVGGFDAYYEGYGAEQHNGAHGVALSILSDGQWEPCTGASACQPLFGGLDASGRLLEASTIEVDRASLRAHARASAQPLAYGIAARNGFFKMQLAEPLGAFGHQAYPQMLAAAVTPRRWGSRAAKTLPNLPYTPLIESLSLDYKAHTTLRLRREGAEAELADGQRMLHLHPFGLSELDPSGPPPGLLPEIEHDGNLYIGLQASDLEGPLSLLFHLHEEGAGDAPRDPRDAPTEGAIEWACMDGDRWQPLPVASVLADSTEAFLSSGIVTLELPPKLARNTTVLDAGLIWLRVAANRGLAAVAPIYGVHAQALALSRVIDPATDPASLPLEAGRVAELRSPLAGLAAVTQIGPSFGLRVAEDERQLRVRAGERLRHKNRASMVWDVEHLVLEQFPEVCKVKCFTPDESGLPAGQMLVVVIPALRWSEAADNTRAPRLSASKLERIREFLAARASSFAAIIVRNVAYERIQVRCTVQPQPGAQGGRVLARVNEAITRHLSPWNDPLHGPRFDWVLRCDDVEAQIRRVAGVQAVAKLSLLGVSSADASGKYILSDTARPAPGRVGGELHASSRWSIALPMQEHLLSAEALHKLAPEPSGVQQLKIGATFVMGRSAA